jgi:hypothetical protein
MALVGCPVPAEVASQQLVETVVVRSEKFAEKFSRLRVDRRAIFADVVQQQLGIVPSVRAQLQEPNQLIENSLRLRLEPRALDDGNLPAIEVTEIALQLLAVKPALYVSGIQRGRAGQDRVGFGSHRLIGVRKRFAVEHCVDHRSCAFVAFRQERAQIVRVIQAEVAIHVPGGDGARRGLSQQYDELQIRVVLVQARCDARIVEVFRRGFEGHTFADGRSQGEVTVVPVPALREQRVLVEEADLLSSCRNDIGVRRKVPVKGNRPRLLRPEDQESGPCVGFALGQIGLSRDVGVR